MMNAEDNKLVFGLDIGTRSIVGTVGYRIGTDRLLWLLRNPLSIRRVP